MSELPRAPGALVNAGFWPRRFSTGAGSDIRRRPAVLQQRQVGVLARHPVFCLMSWRLNTPPLASFTGAGGTQTRTSCTSSTAPSAPPWW